MLDPGRLRHRITIEKPVVFRHPETGTKRVVWQPVFVDVPAAIEPLSVREFIASQSPQGQVVARITIRYRPGLSPDQRILHVAKGKIYNPQGWLEDPDSGMEYVTAPCSAGVNDGE